MNIELDDEKIRTAVLSAIYGGGDYRRDDAVLAHTARCVIGAQSKLLEGIMSKAIANVLTAPNLQAQIEEAMRQSFVEAGREAGVRLGRKTARSAHERLLFADGTQSIIQGRTEP